MSNWRGEASCRDEPKGRFYPDLKTGLYKDYEFISQTCATCPVRHQCRDYAMIRHGERGFWAGTTHATRQILRSQNDTEMKWSLSEAMASSDRIGEYTVAESAMWFM